VTNAHDKSNRNNVSTLVITSMDGERYRVITAQLIRGLGRIMYKNSLVHGRWNAYESRLTRI